MLEKKTRPAKPEQTVETAFHFEVINTDTDHCDQIGCGVQCDMETPAEKTSQHYGQHVSRRSRRFGRRHKLINCSFDFPMSADAVSKNWPPHDATPL